MKIRNQTLGQSKRDFKYWWKKNKEVLNDEEKLVIIYALNNIIEALKSQEYMR